MSLPSTLAVHDAAGVTTSWRWNGVLPVLVIFTVS